MTDYDKQIVRLDVLRVAVAICGESTAEHVVHTAAKMMDFVEGVKNPETEVTNG